MRSLSTGQELAAAKARYRKAKIVMENESRAINYWTAKLYQEADNRRQLSFLDS
ncbi:predicted protein [Cyanophage PSS2]|uniref:hypothetical protein n=1 Tax=Cyanophage PSS2 TaxID=658401 RepID=UPI0001B04000|nr:hypothetical protein PSS2_gp043 [Cyanophage PSS2]ACT65605.1 hypothetical protein [Cyanophage PSS2]ACY75748.1 predicted protein [Cyanophage PSS2]